MKITLTVPVHGTFSADDVAIENVYLSKSRSALAGDVADAYNDYLPDDLRGASKLVLAIMVASFQENT